MPYVRPTVQMMAAYVPGEQPPLGTPVLKLNSNENPYPPSPAALQALQNITGEALRRYPDPMARSVCRAASAALGIPEDWILVGNGSDDLLSVIVRACADSDRPIVYPSPTYVLYRTLAEMQAAQRIEVAYDEAFNLPVDGLVAAQGAVTLVAAPNSPSGTAIPIEQLSTLAARLSGVLVIDEAYVDFAEADALSVVQAHENVILLRTLSKGYALAGLRLGFAIAHPLLRQELMKVKDSYNIDAIACAVATAAIADQPYKIEIAERVKASRTQLAIALKQLNFEVYPSQTNFLLVRPPQGDAERLYLALKERGILVRYFNQPRLDDKLRISIGTEAQNQVVVEAIAQLIS